ncbi:exported hypothetical protein [Agrobacterium fabacearum CFBP 5771]|nr:exported hypothetical protein [Agrobacterium fabacearum CFBP 5771]
MMGFSNRNRMTFAGLPATIAYGGTSFVTTAPAPITAPWPIVRPFKTIAPAPNHTSLPIRILLDLLLPSGGEFLTKGAVCAISSFGNQFRDIRKKLVDK